MRLTDVEVVVGGIVIAIVSGIVFVERWYTAEMRGIRSSLLTLDGVERVDTTGTYDVSLQDIRAKLWLSNGRLLSFTGLTREVIDHSDSDASELYLSGVGRWRFKVDFELPTGSARTNRIDLTQTIPDCELSFGIRSVADAIDRYGEIHGRVEQIAASGVPVTYELPAKVVQVRVVPAERKPP